MAQIVGSIAGQTDGASFVGKVSTDPQADQQLMSDAVNAKPAAIVVPGISDASLLQGTASSRAAHVKTVGIAVEQSVPSGQGYDAYVSVRQDIGYPMMLTTALADSGGNAHVAVFTASDLATVTGYVDNAKRQFLKQCSRCSVVIKAVDVAALLDPTQLDQLVTSVLNADPSINYLAFGDDYYQFAVVQQAVARLNRKVTLISQDGSSAGLQAVKAGLLKYDVGVPLEWIAYAAYDQIRRVLAGQAPLPPNGWGGGLHLWTSANLPSEVNDETGATKIWRTLVPYQAAYKAAW